MTCGANTPTFRLLDPYVGWDAQALNGSLNLSIRNDPSGFLRLDLITPEAEDESAILRYLPPPRLARSCEPCEWYLVTPKPSRLLRLDRCSGIWLPVWSKICDPGLLCEAVAIAIKGRYLAVADSHADKVLIWAGGGVRLEAEIEIEAPGPIAFSCQGELIAVSRKSQNLICLSLDGQIRKTPDLQLPESADTIERLAVGKDGSIWLQSRSGNGVLQLWRVGRGELSFQPSTVEKLSLVFDPTEITVAAEGMGFCLEAIGPDGIPIERCFSWEGFLLERSALPVPPQPKRHSQGQLLTQPIDSGIPRCRWHRVRIEGEAPLGTKLEIAISTSDEQDPVDQGILAAHSLWSDFPSGLPHPDDWQTATAWDFLIDQPPGRYLFLRLRLTGDGIATPEINRIRLDFPRDTSLEFLPAVYRDSPEAEDFTERFLSLFDAGIEDLDRAIERYPALLDASGVPDEILPWLGSFLDIAIDPSWGANRLRTILQAVPQLYSRRSTLDGIKLACYLVFGIEPVIRELGAERPWGALRHNAMLGQVRLFGKSRSRVKLGSSPLGGARIKSYGNPDHDPLNIGAYRLQVLVPPVSGQSAGWQEQFQRLVESQKPAHNVVEFGFAEGGFILGQRVSLGVDTAFVSPPAPVLGAQGNIRLNRGSVLWAGIRGKTDGIVVGGNVRVGIHTTLE